MRISTFGFFHRNNLSGLPDSNPEAILNTDLNLPRYSIFFKAHATKSTNTHNDLFSKSSNKILFLVDLWSSYSPTFSFSKKFPFKGTGYCIYFGGLIN